MTDEAGSIFLDTSIQIARTVHAPEIKQDIRRRLAMHGRIISGLIVRQEFKRRLLKEAVYLLKQLNERGSFEKVMRHVADTLPRFQERKRRISLQLLMTVDEADGDDDRFDRARYVLRDLIRNGIATSEAHLTRLNESSGCACAKQPITELKPFVKYEFGTDRCSRTKSACGVCEFLEDHRAALSHIGSYLAAITPGDKPGQKSAELQRAEDFIRGFLQGNRDVQSADPCLTVGDLLIALESIDCDTFYTMNSKETQHLARALEQSMIYRAPNPDHAEVQCSADSPNWPQY